MLRKIVCIVVSFAMSSSLVLADPAALLLKSNTDSNQWIQPSAIPYVTFKLVAPSGSNWIGMGIKSDKPVFLKSADDGASWMTSSFPAGFEVNALYSDANQIFAVGKPTEKMSTMLRSLDDGMHWTSVPLTTQYSYPLIDSISGNTTTLMAIGMDIEVITYSGGSKSFRKHPLIMTSKDHGQSWKQIPFADKNNPIEEFKFIIWDGTQWVGAGTYFSWKKFPTDRGFVMTSPDGENWTISEVYVKGYWNAQRIFSMAAHDGEIMVIGGEPPIGGSQPHQSLFRSVDNGKTWSIMTVINERPDPVARMDTIKWNGRVWMLGGIAYWNIAEYFNRTLPLVLTSADGVSWQRQALPNEVLIDRGYDFRNHFINDAAWNGKSWMVVGLYEKPLAGCETFSQQWIGTLINSKSSSLNVTNLQLTVYPSSEGFRVGGSMSYQSGSAEVFEGLGGTCVEKNGMAYLDVSNNNPISHAHLVAEKTFTGNQMKVTQSNLMDATHSYGNYVGTLSH